MKGCSFMMYSPGKDQWKRFFPGICMVLVILLLIASGAYAAKKVTLVHLNYYWHGESWRKFLQDAAGEFMKKNPDVEIKIMTAGDSGTYPAKLAAMTAAGIPPDVTEMYPKMAAPFVSEGFFLDLRPFIARDKVNLSDFAPVAIKGFTWFDGSIWALPADLGADVTFYNVDLLDEAGLKTPGELGSRWNWDAVIEMGKKLTKDVNGDGQIDQYGVDRVWAMWSRGCTLVQAGARLYDRFMAPTQSRWDSPEVEKALQFVADLFLKYRVTLPYGDPKASQCYFWTGKTALDMVDGSGIMAPYLSKVDFKWGVTLQPAGPAGTGATGGADGWQISRDSKHPEEAWRWIKFLAYEKETVFNFVNTTGRLTSLIPIQTRLPKAWKVFIEAANHPNTIPGYVIPQATEIDAFANPLTDRVFRGQISAREALIQIHRQVTEILKRKR